MDSSTILDLAQKLHHARKNCTPIEQLSKTYKDFSERDAYQIQKEGISMRLKEGEVVIGLKMGLTSKAKREQMNLSSPLYGALTNKMEVKNNSEFSLKNLIHSKIEPEVAFYMEKDLSGEVDRETVLNAIKWVTTCFEVLDSRYDQFKYFSLEDVISDNSSSSHFILGEDRKNPREIDLLNIDLKMCVNGKIEREGLSKDISDDPINSVIDLVKLLSQNGEILKKDTIVLAGAATSAIELKPDMEVVLQSSHFKPVTIGIIS